LSHSLRAPKKQNERGRLNFIESKSNDYTVILLKLSYVFENYKYDVVSVLNFKLKGCTSFFSQGIDPSVLVNY